MFSIRGGCAAAVLLLVFAKSFTLANMSDDIEKVITVSNNVRGDIGSLLRVSRINEILGIESLARATETEASCVDDVAVVLQAFSSSEDWAVQMLDASSKIQSGITQGNVRDLGMYDQCVRVNGKYNDTAIQGKHCMVSFGQITSSVCVPSSCNETDVADLVSQAIQNETILEELELAVSGVSCARVGNEDFTVEEILTIAFFSLVGTFVLFCTACEFVTKSRAKRGSAVLETLAKFSLYANGIALMSTRVSPKMMPAIQGMRFLSMCWVVLGHRYVTTLSSPMVNSVDLLNWIRSWVAIHIVAAPFAVDTFFVVSGFLMCYLYLKSKQSGSRSHFPMMYLHRYLRLTPAVAVLMLFVAVVLRRVANGPIWDSSLEGTIDNCRENWWINLLYVQNFVRREKMCLGHSWYLAVDMQLFWISPIILYPLYRWPKIGLGILGLFGIGSVVAPAVILAVYGYSNAAIGLKVGINTMDTFYYFYIPTYTRACAYFVGIFLGYDLANNNRTFAQRNVAINWVVACIFLLLCGLATKYLHDYNLEYNVYLETVFAVTLRPLWSVAIAWIIYACTQGYGGPVTSFLSLPIFLPLSRLSYCIYLVHMVLQQAKNAAVRIPTKFSSLAMLDRFWADLVLSIVVAFFLSLFFESPVLVIEKILKAPRRRKERSAPASDSKKDVEHGIDNRCAQTAD